MLCDIPHRIHGRGRGPEHMHGRRGSGPVRWAGHRAVQRGEPCVSQRQRAVAPGVGHSRRASRETPVDFPAVLRCDELPLRPVAAVVALGRADALRAEGQYRDKFEHRAEYRHLLQLVFERAAPHLSSNTTVYVRMDRRELTYTATQEVLTEVFTNKALRRIAPGEEGANSDSTVRPKRIEGRGSRSHSAHEVRAADPL